jgi:adenylate cyclase class 2
MKTEIETRFLDIDKKLIIELLHSLGATDKGDVKLDEIIFYDTGNRWKNENKFVKIRNNGKVIKLIYKENSNKTIDGAHEIEFEVSDVSAAKAFVEALGLVAYRTVEKYRHTFVLDGVTLDIDTWPKIPVYVELEGESVSAIRDVAEKLGFIWENRFDGDPRFVFKKYGFDFDNIHTVTFSKFE